MFTLDERSFKRLDKVHPSLVRVVKRAIELSTVDFSVIEGVRTLEKQKEYFNKGASKTMKSRHLIQSDGYGHAVDLAPLIEKHLTDKEWNYSKGDLDIAKDAKIPWNSWKAFDEVAKAMKQAAKELNINITWGGDWKSFKDGPHFQIEL